MIISTAFFRSHERYGFHGGEVAEILGVRIVTPKGGEMRACFVVRYPNGDEDLTPCEEALATCRVETKGGVAVEPGSGR